MDIFISRKVPELAILKLKAKGFEVEVWEDELPPDPKFLTAKLINAKAAIVTLSDIIDKNTLSMSKNLKIIANYAAGFNNIDIEAAKEFNIIITNTPDVLTSATADLTFALMINLMRKIQFSTKYIQDGLWKTWAPTGPLLGESLVGKTVGIIGAGKIGQAFARRCFKGFEMNIQYHSKSRKLGFEKECEANFLDLESLVKTSDVISIHTNLNSETKNLFTKNLFAKMKTNAFFINTARGEIHNENDLLFAIQNKLIAGAALDVTNPEPISIDSPLLKLDNVLITPHIGSATNEAREKMAILCAENILNVLEGRKPLTSVN